MQQYILIASVTLISFFTSLCSAEDVELYVRNNVQTGQKTKVLVVFDTSGSMAFNSITGADCGYNWSKRLWNLCPNHRLGVAKEALLKLVDESPDIDFGLMRFNSNNQGGYVVAGIGSPTSEIKNKINAMVAKGGTPLSETLWEAYLYITGNTTRFSQSGATGKDVTVESNGKYISPFTPKAGEVRCDNSINVIVLTDGDPSADSAANSNINNLHVNIFGKGGSAVRRNYMPVLASAMSGFTDGKRQSVDLYDNADDIDHIANIYTIGFGTGMSATGREILEKTAKNGAGKYLQANTASQLAETFKTTVDQIREKNDSFVSPSVSTNSKDQTQTGNSLYYTMFYPQKHTRWLGNLKKLQISNGEIVDLNGVKAIDNNGAIDKNATTFWSQLEPKDGNEVKKGGVRHQLAKQISRKVYSNFNGTSLEEFTYNNAVRSYGDNALASVLGATTSESESIINWARGIDVDDEDQDNSTTDRRVDTFGDPLHSKPVSMDYGEGDTRVFVGTNAGVLHMFKDKGKTVEESWAFVPGSLLSILKPLKDRDNTKKYYGMDGPMTVYFDDKNKDGSVNGQDKVWLFVGMRRGGREYFAFDITNPDSPELLWTLSPQKSGFAELGQTWSKPIVSKIRQEGDEPVVIFAAGYDTNKDKPARSDDNKGRGIFIVKAKTGDLIWALTPSSNNVSFMGKHSIAAELSVLDTDYDGYIDRIYAADTGGGVWRVDMPEKSPTHNVSPWTHFQFADLGADDTTNDRRFFYKPIIARTMFSKVVETTSPSGNKILTRHEVPYEAILLGSGDRTNPLGNDTQEYLFTLRDENTRTRSFKDPNDYSTITIGKLFDITNEPFVSASSSLDDFKEVEAELGTFKGWKYKLSGREKSLAKATVYDGVAYFTSFTSADLSVDKCSLSGGQGSVYALHLHYGSKVYDELRFDTVADVPDAPTIIRYNKIDGKRTQSGTGGLILNVKNNDTLASNGPGKSGEAWVTKTIVGPEPKLKNGKVETSSASKSTQLRTRLLYIYKREKNDAK